jgi:flagellar motor switch/type III secretory pathway protein FliN
LGDDLFLSLPMSASLKESLQTALETVYQLPPLFDTTFSARPQVPVPRSAYRQNVLRATVPIVATIATTRVPYGQLRRIEVGTILDFDVSPLDSVTLKAQGRTIARGNCVTAGASLGVRVATLTSIATPPVAS